MNFETEKSKGQKFFSIKWSELPVRYHYYLSKYNQELGGEIDQKLLPWYKKAMKSYGGKYEIFALQTDRGTDIMKKGM